MGCIDRGGNGARTVEKMISVETGAQHQYNFTFGILLLKQPLKLGPDFRPRKASPRAIRLPNTCVDGAFAARAHPSARPKVDLARPRWRE